MQLLEIIQVTLGGVFFKIEWRLLIMLVFGELVMVKVLKFGVITGYHISKVIEFGLLNLQIVFFQMWKTNTFRSERMEFSID